MVVKLSRVTELAREWAEAKCLYRKSVTRVKGPGWYAMDDDREGRWHAARKKVRARAAAFTAREMAAFCGEVVARCETLGQAASALKALAILLEEGPDEGPPAGKLPFYLTRKPPG